MKKLSIIVIGMLFLSLACANTAKCNMQDGTMMNKAECKTQMKNCMEKCGTKCCKDCKACAAMKSMANDCKDCPDCQGKTGKALKKAQKACMEKMKADCAAGCTDKKCKAECCKKDMKDKKAKK